MVWVGLGGGKINPFGWRGGAIKVYMHQEKIVHDFDLQRRPGVHLKELLTVVYIT